MNRKIANVPFPDEIGQTEPMNKMNFEDLIKKYYSTPLKFSYSWQQKIKMYCDKTGITPEQLIEQHKAAYSDI